MRATIIAFDGCLADTLPLRRHALREACTAEGVAVAEHRLEDALPGCTFAEAVAVLASSSADSSGTRGEGTLQGSEAWLADPTLGELIALRAQRAFGALVAHGVAMRHDLVDALRAQHAAGTRVVIRADSERRHVEPLLALAGLDHVVSLLRCCDDRPRGAEPSLRRSWVAIDARLNRLGVGQTDRTACETTAMTAATAAPYVATVTVGILP